MQTHGFIIRLFYVRTLLVSSLSYETPGYFWKVLWVIFSQLGIMWILEIQVSKLKPDLIFCTVINVDLLRINATLSHFAETHVNNTMRMASLVQSEKSVVKPTPTFTRWRGRAPRPVRSAPDVLWPIEGPHLTAIGNDTPVRVRLLLAIHHCVRHLRRLVTFHGWERNMSRFNGYKRGHINGTVISDASVAHCTFTDRFASIPAFIHAPSGSPADKLIPGSIIFKH